MSKVTLKYTCNLVNLDCEHSIADLNFSLGDEVECAICVEIKAARVEALENKNAYFGVRARFGHKLRDGSQIDLDIIISNGPTKYALIVNKEPVHKMRLNKIEFWNGELSEEHLQKLIEATNAN